MSNLNDGLGNFPTATIHIDALQKNFNLVRTLAPDSKIIAVVKANAYGHGAVKVCQSLQGVAAFGIARVIEGVQLRRSGVTQPLIVLQGYLNEAELLTCRTHDLVPVVHSRFQLDLLDNGPAWLKLNTGMHRLGFNLNDTSLIQKTIKDKLIVGVMSHFANSEKINHQLNQKQLEDFLERTEGLGVDLAISNSGAVMTLQDKVFDYVRPGIMIYGGSPNGLPDPRLSAAMTLSAPVLSINELSVGDCIGYGSLFEAESPCRVAVVGLGYADGFPREMPTGAPVLVNGERRKLVGRVSMDMCFVKLEDTDDVQIGDQVVFWGPKLSVDEVATWANTVSYTLMTGLTERVQRIYTN